MDPKSNPTTLLAPTCLAVLAAIVGAVHAAPVSIANHSFESPVNPNSEGRYAFGESRDFGPNGATNTVEDGDENNITDWTTVTTENTSTNVPAGAQLAVGFFEIAPADGSQVLSLITGASTKQFTSLAWSSLTVGDQITVTVALGDRTSTTTWADESFFALIDGSTSGTLAAGTLLSSTVAHSGALATPFAGGSGIDGGTMQDRSFTYTVQAGDLARVGNVGVLLAAFGTTGAGNGLTSNLNQAYFDNVTLDYISAAQPPRITTFTAVGGGVWELTLVGNANTDYEFRSSATLEFNPGTLVENLTQGDLGDPGTVGGTNDSVLTTDGSGNATVRLTLTGDPKDFVRAASRP